MTFAAEFVANKMAASKESNFNNLLAEITKYGQTSDWERGLKVAAKINQVVDHNDTRGIQCKVVCLVHLGRFGEAETLIHGSAAALKHCTFEYAYCLYRQNKTQKAFDVLQNVQNQTLQMKELLAQVLFRLEKYDECFNVYKDVIKNSVDEYEEERRTNLTAVIANMYAVKSKLTRDAPRLEETTYEIMYNSACALLAQGLYTEAREKLKKSEELCRKFLEEDEVPEDEIEDEIAIIKIQGAYVLQMLGKHDEAGRIYANVLKNKPSDIGLVAVASNNIVSINKEQNLFDSKKKIKSASSEGLENKLTNQQRLCIAINQCLISMHTSQGEKCRQQIAILKSKFPDNLDLVLIEAANLCKENKVNEAVELLQQFASTHPNDSAAISFCIVHLLLTHGNAAEACSVLRSIANLWYKPGVVSSLVTLYLGKDDKAAASKVLKEAVDWYKTHEPQSQNLPMLWRQNANVHLRSGQAQEAANSLEELRKLNPNDTKTLAQLITAYSEFDPEKARNLSNDLPAVDGLVGNVDVDALENNTWTLGAKQLRKAKADVSPSVKSGKHVDELIVKKKKKKKKTKKPKNCVGDPDLERWLPKRERTSFKKRKDRRERGAAAGQASSGIGRGTQGSTGASADIDATLTATSPKAAPHTSPNLPPGPRQQKPQQALKKKKKKGGGKS